MQEMLKYNYIYLGANSDLYRTSYSDLKKMKGVTYIDDLSELFGSLHFLYKIHFSKTINSIVRLPFHGIWNFFYKKSFYGDKKPLCFVLSGYWIRTEKYTNLIDYLKSNYPDSRFVWVASDLIKNYKNYFQDTPIDLKVIKEKVDAIFSFDQNDVKNYGLKYYPLVFSAIEDCDISIDSYSDVYFLGNAKNRLKAIIEVYEYLKEKGLKLDFHITNVHPNEQVYPDEIKYNTRMSYSDNLNHVKHTRCLLEIMQEGGHGYTQRVNEAVCLGKKLITNNPEIKEAPFFNPNYMLRFEKPQDITDDFIKNILTISFVDYGYKENMSPIKLIKHIDNYLAESY